MWLILASLLIATDKQPAVRDAARVFSADAVARANDQIREMQLPFDFVIETTSENAHAEDVSGVHVLIQKTPKAPTVTVDVQPEELRTRFTEKDRTELRKIFETRLRKQRSDAALERAVEWLRDKVKPAHTEDSSHVVFIVIGGLLALWLVLILLRMRWTKPEQPAKPPGFTARLLSGMFGTAAGHWIGDRF